MLELRLLAIGVCSIRVASVLMLVAIVRPFVKVNLGEAVGAATYFHDLEFVICHLIILGRGLEGTGLMLSVHLYLFIINCK